MRVKTVMKDFLGLILSPAELQTTKRSKGKLTDWNAAVVTEFCKPVVGRGNYKNSFSAVSKFASNWLEMMLPKYVLKHKLYMMCFTESGLQLTVALIDLLMFVMKDQIQRGGGYNTITLFQKSLYSSCPQLGNG